MHALPEAGAGSAATQPAAEEAALRLLIVEDEPEAAAYLAERLKVNGWRVQLAGDGETGLALALRRGFHVILVDRMLPARDGLSMVRELRRRGDETPVMFMTAMGAVSDRIDGFDGGGDDYLVKPFAFEELDARLRALLRRRQGGAAERVTIRVRDLEINRIERSVRRAEVEIDLLPLEYKLLEFLALRTGEVVTRTMLLEGVWGFQFDPRTNIVETHISRLRSKITPPGAKPLILTRRGAGYVVEAY